jgi:tetratricopeptide (TPR) repeat protein
MQREIRINKLLEMKTLMSSDPFPTYALGLEYQEMGEAAKAIAFFEETILKFPHYLPVYYQLGLLLTGNGEIQRAKDCINAGITLARATKDLKTLGELQEALFNIDE